MRWFILVAFIPITSYADTYAQRRQCVEICVQQQVERNHECSEKLASHDCKVESKAKANNCILACGCDPHNQNNMCE